jgi:dolichol kinase
MIVSQALDVSVADATPVPLSRAEKRPTNVTRSTFHVASGVIALALIALLPSRGWLVAASGAFAVAAWSMEIARRQSRAVNERLMRLFSPVAHAHERHEVNSSTWYVTALLLLAVLAPPPAAAVAVVVLAIGDPMAALIGRRYGRHRLASGRSLEGALTFVLTAGVAAWGALALIGVAPGTARIFIAAAGAVAGAAAELSSSRLDDNFTIPVASAAAATGAMALWMP